MELIERVNKGELVDPANGDLPGIEHSAEKFLAHHATHARLRRGSST